MYKYKKENRPKKIKDKCLNTNCNKTLTTADVLYSKKKGYCMLCNGPQ